MNSPAYGLPIVTEDQSIETTLYAAIEDCLLDCHLAGIDAPATAESLIAEAISEQAERILAKATT